LIEKLPPRERQVFEAVLALGRSTIADLEHKLPDPPSGSALRAMLTRLEEKGFVKHEVVLKKNVYSPAVSEATARKSVLRQMVSSFFNNSPASAAAALLGMEEKIEPEHLDELERLIRKARQEQDQ
jgi:predicted transcriptional regulator